jgi:hypothetical protein
MVSHTGWPSRSDRDLLADPSPFLPVGRAESSRASLLKPEYWACLLKPEYCSNCPFTSGLVRGIRSSSGGRPPNPHVRTVQRCGIGRRRRTLQQELGADARSAARQPGIPCNSGLTPF